MTKALLNAGQAQTNHRYEGATRIGTVIERRTGKSGPQVRIQYADRGVASAWTPVAQRNTVGTKDYNLPRLGERVLVQHLANGAERGVVTGCLFNEAVSTVPQGNPDNREIVFDDGTVIRYDPGAKSMLIDAAGTISITSEGAVSVTAPTVTIKGNVRIEGDLEVDGDVSNTGDMQTDGVHRDQIGGHS